MAGSKTGTPSIWRKMREIATLKQKYGAADAATRLSPDVADCINAIVICVTAHLLTDDYILMVDRTGEAGPEDPI